MKGQSVVVSTVLSILIQTIVVVAVILSFRDVYDARKQAVVKSRAFSLCKQVRLALLAMHDGDNYLSIRNNRYSIRFLNSTIKIQNANVSCNAPGFVISGIGAGNNMAFHLKSFNKTVYGWVE